MSQREILLRWLRARAARGLPLPTLGGIGQEIGIPDRNRVGDLLREAQRLGLVEVLHGLRGIAAIAASDGSWRIERGEAEALPKRRCLRCRRPFQPEHRTNFLCGCPEPGARSQRRELAAESAV